MILLLAKPVSLHLTLLNLCLLFNAHLSACEFGEQNNGAITYNRYQPETITPQQNDERLNQALAFAVIDGNLDVVKLTLSRGADINAKDKHGWTPLFHAVKHGELEIASYLLENGAEVNLISVLGTTPLRLASAQGDIDMVKLLLAKGADANLTGDHGYSPLHRAAEESKNVEVVRMLISHGANVNARSRDGRTPLMKSCYVPEITKVLIESRAEIDAQDDEGRTALFFASYYRCRATARILVENGADPNIKNKQGESAWDIARKRKDKELYKIFLGKK